jgi:hypothetical protein
MVVGRNAHAWSKHARIPFNIVECPESAAVVPELAKLCGRMLSPSRYLSAGWMGAEIQLQQFVRDWLRGDGTALGGYGDRHKSFDLLLRAMSVRFSRPPRVVETGCIRVEEDFQGAGFSTYILGAYLHKRGGRLISVDNDETHCAFARAWTACFGDAVSVVRSDSVDWLSLNREPIDVLYLDSIDTDLPGAAEHGLKEVEAAYPQLRDDSIVVYDDTAYSQKRFCGGGARGVPWLMERGWKILYSGHQSVLSRVN